MRELEARGRAFSRAISKEVYSELFGEATFRTLYRGLPFAKLAFDVVIYMQMLGKLQPATVIEIGTYHGGSALWFADMMSATGKQARVVSVDLKKPRLLDPRITFLEGDACDLGAVLTEDLLASLPRPWLVSEDCAHVYETTKATLDFFKDRLGVGEYLVVEDGVVGEFSGNNGPNEAVTRFLAEAPNYEIDAELCDFFGFNVTGNPNGYMKRVA